MVKMKNKAQLQQISDVAWLVRQGPRKLGILNKDVQEHYFYINGKPEVSTLLDSFGDWPYYILVGELVIIPYFLIIYLPFYLLKKSN